MPVTYVRVHLPAISHNVRQVLDRLAGGRLMAVVKGNAYGHGLVPVARACLAAGAHWLGVSYVEEGVTLRQAGVEAPILAFLPPTEEQAASAVACRVTVTVTTEEHLAALRAAADRTGQTAQAQIFVDADLGRPSAGDDLVRLLEIASGFRQLEISGVYTHFDAGRPAPIRSALDIARPGTELAVFAATVKALARQHLEREILFHAAASAMFLNQPEAHLDMVRLGTLLYGQYPPGVPAKKRTLNLDAHTFELCSTIVAVDDLPAGATVGYGGEFVCRRPTRVATLPIGYAQGLSLVPASLARRQCTPWRRLLGRREQLVIVLGSRAAPIIGRIGMDQCAVDVTDLPEAGVGSVVTIPTRRTTISPEVPRLYDQ